MCLLETPLIPKSLLWVPACDGVTPKNGLIKQEDRMCVGYHV